MNKDVKENMDRNGDTVAGWCKCCGNQVLIRAFGLKTQEEYDEEATRQCNCDGAEELRYRAEQASIAHGKAKSMLEEINLDVAAIISRAIDLAAEKKLKQLTVKLEKGITIKVTVTSKSTIKLVKETKETETEEA